MSLDLLLEAALFVEQQQQISQPAPKGEDPKLLNGHHHHNGYEHPHAASVIQRLPPSAATNGSSQSCSPTPNGYSPKMQDVVLVIPEQQQQQQTSSSSNYRVDDVASRSHRLEEALLRASRNKSPIQQYPAGGGGGSSSGRTSADELSDLKKRTGAGTREVHNKLEKNRRAHLRECFEFLRKQLPAVDDKKLSNLGILKSALRFIQTLKRKEREYEHTMERLAREKIAAQQRLASLRKEVSVLPGYSGMIPATLDVELDGLEEQEEGHSLTLANVAAHTIRTTSSTTSRTTDYPRSMDNADRDSNSGTSTASERGDDYMSADENGGDGPSAFPPESYSHATQPVHVVRPVAQHASNGRMQPVEEVIQRPVILPPSSSYNIKYVRPIVSSSSSTTTYLTVLPDGSTPGGGQLYQAFAAAQPPPPPPSVQQQTTLKVLTQAGGQPGTTTSLRLVTAPDGVSTSLQSIVTTSGGKMSEAEGFCIPAGVVIPSLVAIPASSGSESSSLPSSAAYDPSRISTSSPHLIKSNSPTVLSLPNGVLKASRSLQTSSTSGVTHVMTPIAVTRSLPPGHVMTGMAVMGQPAHILTGSSLGKVGLQLKPGTFPIIGGQYVSTGTASGGVRAQLIKPMMVVSAAAPLPITSSIISVTTTSTSSSNPAGSNPGPKYHHHHPPNC